MYPKKTKCILSISLTIQAYGFAFLLLVATVKPWYSPNHVYLCMNVVAIAPSPAPGIVDGAISTSGGTVK